MQKSIEFLSVNKEYLIPSFIPWKSKKIQALNGTDFFCPKGKLTCLLGPNGAGKTTIIKIIAGLIYHDHGSVKIDGENVKMDSYESHRKIGIMTPNDRSFYWRLSGRENLDFFCTLNGYNGKEKKQMMDSIFEDLDFTNDADKDYRLYSSGMKQKLLLARALIGKPEILLLDEPTAHLDPIAKENLYRLIDNVFIRKKNMTILLCTHDLSEAENLADHIILLNKGTVLEQGSYSDLASLLKNEVSLDIEFAGKYEKKHFEGLGTGLKLIESGKVRISLENRDDIPVIVKKLSGRGCRIISCIPVKESLIDIYSRLAGGF